MISHPVPSGLPDWLLQWPWELSHHRCLSDLEDASWHFPALPLVPLDSEREHLENGCWQLSHPVSHLWGQHAPQITVYPKGWHHSVPTDITAKGGVGEAGGNPQPMTLGGRNPIGLKGARASLCSLVMHFVIDPPGSFFKTTSKGAAMTRGTGMCPWESPARHRAYPC